MASFDVYKKENSCCKIQSVTYEWPLESGTNSTTKPLTSHCSIGHIENKKNSWFPWATVAPSPRFTSGTLPMSRKQLFSSTPGIQNNLKLVTSHDEKKTTTNKRAWFYQRLIRLDTKTRRCKRFQTVATGSKIQPRCVGLVIGMDWSFCRFLIALSTAIRLMTTASSAIASRFTWRNMAQDKQVKKKATTVHLGSRLKISGCFRCYPKLPSKKKRRGWNAFCSQEGLVSACFRFSESERSMTFVTRSSSSARTQRSSLSPCHDLFPHEITLDVFFFSLPCHL